MAPDQRGRPSPHYGLGTGSGLGKLSGKLRPRDPNRGFWVRMTFRPNSTVFLPDGTWAQDAEQPSTNINYLLHTGSEPGSELYMLRLILASENLEDRYMYVITEEMSQEKSNQFPRSHSQ